MAQNALDIFRVIVIGGSAGSLDVLLRIMSQVPTGFNCVIIIVIHRKNDKESILENLLENRTKLKVKEVEDKEPIEVNTVYLAPPDYHLLIENEVSFSLDSSEKIQFSRPSIDVTFESAAEIFKERVIGILLSGANADGAAGMLKIKQAGGFTIAQEPATADVAFMPQQAINLHAVDAVIPGEKLPQQLLDHLLKEQIAKRDAS